MRAAIYCRVSTEDQQERGTIQNQLDYSEKYVSLHNIDVYKIYKDDGVSGIIPFDKREGGAAVIEDAKKGLFDVLLSYKIDRLGRSVKVILDAIEMLEDIGIKVRSMSEPFDNDSSTGKFMINMLASVATLERDTFRERSQQGTERAALEGKWLGGIVPYGYRVKPDKFLEINEDKMPCGYSEADVVRTIYNMCGENNKSTLVMADYLNDSGIPTHYIKDGRMIKDGKRKVHTEGIWRPSRIGNMLRNPIYMGIHRYGKRSTRERDTVERVMPAIVTPEEWRLAQDNLAKRNLFALRNTKDNSYILRGLIKCAHCGRTYIGSKFKSKKIDETITLKRYYVCSGKSNAYKYIKLETKCKAAAVDAGYIETYVWNRILGLIDDPDRLDTETDNSDVRDYSAEIAALEIKLLEIESEKEKVMYLYRKKYITTNEVDKEFEKIDQELAKKSMEIKTLKMLRSGNDERKEKIDTAKKLLNKYKGRVGQAEPDEMASIIRSVISGIRVTTVRERKSRPKTEIDISYIF